jgi:hypothetical protein
LGEEVDVLWSALIVGLIGVVPALHGSGVSVGWKGTQDPAREARLEELRVRARSRIEAERFAFSATELADIEALYASAQAKEPGLARPAHADRTLEELIKRYPRSNRAGCALLELAQLSNGIRRERYLREAIRFGGDAWFENGVQVAALARAMLAVHLAGLDRFDEAERLATELVTQYPGSVDQTGASLDDTLTAIKLLRVKLEYTRVRVMMGVPGLTAEAQKTDIRADLARARAGGQSSLKRDQFAERGARMARREERAYWA